MPGFYACPGCEGTFRDEGAFLSHLDWCDEYQDWVYQCVMPPEVRQWSNPDPGR